MSTNETPQPEINKNYLSRLTNDQLQNVYHEYPSGGEHRQIIERELKRRRVHGEVVEASTNETQSEVERLRNEILKIQKNDSAWKDYPGHDYSKELAAFEAAVRAEAAGEIAELEAKYNNASVKLNRYAVAVRVIASQLGEFCDELPYDEMIAEAARRARKELDARAAAPSTGEPAAVQSIAETIIPTHTDMYGQPIRVTEQWGGAQYLCERPKMLTYCVSEDHFKRYCKPLQPNGVPVGISAAPAQSEQTDSIPWIRHFHKKCLMCDWDGILEYRPGDFMHCPKCDSGRLKDVEAAAPAVKEPDNAD